MTTHQLKRLLNHPIINARGLCNEAGLSYSDVYDIISEEYEITEREYRKIEAYLKTRGIQWRDLIKEGL